jgi:hypothetical protein
VYYDYESELQSFSFFAVYAVYVLMHVLVNLHTLLHECDTNARKACRFPSYFRQGANRQTLTELVTEVSTEFQRTGKKFIHRRSQRVTRTFRSFSPPLIIIPASAAWDGADLISLLLPACGALVICRACASEGSPNLGRAFDRGRYDGLSGSWWCDGLLGSTFRFEASVE